MAGQSAVIAILVFLSGSALAAPPATPPKPAAQPAAKPVAKPALDADATISPDDIKAAYDKGDYQETLRLLGRVLSLKGKAGEGYDRYELLMLKAESHLRLKANSLAIDSLTSAAAEAPDEKAAAEARALVLLIKRAKNFQYTPRAAGVAGKKDSSAIDITDMKRRPEAFEALYLEEKAAAKPKVQAADKGKTLPPIATALKAVQPLKDLEVAATGKDAESVETFNLLIDRAHTLMAKSVDDMTKRTVRISDQANELIQQDLLRRDGTVETKTSRRGLDQENRRELKDIIATCKKVVESCKEIAAGFTEDDKPFEDLEDTAHETEVLATETLNDNYSRIR